METKHVFPINTCSLVLSKTVASPCPDAARTILRLVFLVRSLQEMPTRFVLIPSSTFAIFITHSLRLWSRMGSRVKITHYIQPSNFSSALLFVCVGPTQCCLNVTILQRISSFWNTITNKLEGGRLLRELGSWKLKSTFHKMQIIIIGSKKCQTNKTIFFFIQVCLGSVFCSLHKELIFFLFEEFEIWQWCSPKCWILACPVRICTQTLPSLRAIGCWNLNVLCIIFNRKVFTKKSTTKDWGGSLFFSQKVIEQ